MQWEFAGALLLIAATAAPFTARAAEPGEDAEQSEPPTVNTEPQRREDPPGRNARWYGWQTLASDAASVGLMLTGFGVAASERGNGSTLAWAFIGAGTVGYLAGGPTLHAFHHNPGRSIASVGLRLGLPIFSALLGSTTETCPSGPDNDFSVCGLDGAVAGVAIGMLGAIVIDATALSWDDRAFSNAREYAAGPQLGFTPVISSDGKRGELRIFGTF